LCAEKGRIEAHCYERLTNLANLDLRLCCYDLTSTYVEGDPRPSVRFPSKAFGYSRDKRGDRPQVVIGLLVTGDGIPIAHHVFAGNTKDQSTLEEVMTDLQQRFGVGKIALVADRGLISESNLEAVSAAGFDHVMATRLHRDHDVAEVLAVAKDATAWVEVDDHTTATEVLHQDRRYVVVDSVERKRRDDHRREELLSRTEDKLIALAERVSSGRLVDPAKIGAAADRILRDSGVGRCFTTTIRTGSFFWEYDQEALTYETDLLAGRYVILTSLTKTQAPTTQVVRHYKALQSVERRFRVLKDFLALRPIYHFTENRVRGHIALCVLAALVEVLMGQDLAKARVVDPDLDFQIESPRRALRDLERIRAVQLTADDGSTRRVITKPTEHQAHILEAMDVDTSTWTSRLSG
jgi:transposase